MLENMIQKSHNYLVLQTAVEICVIWKMARIKSGEVHQNFLNGMRASVAIAYYLVHGTHMVLVPVVTYRD